VQDDDERSRASFYDPDVVQTVELDIAPSDVERMLAALPERVYVPGTFRWNGREVQNVGIRFKGDSSSRPEQRHKRSFLVKFSEYVAGQRFLGLRRVALDNGVQFGSLFSERLITDALRDVGVRAPRTSYARVSLNGEYQGVYVNVERIDRAYLRHRFDDADGALYKVHRGGPGADLRFVGDEPLLYSKAFEPKGADESVAPIADLIRGLHRVPQEEFAARFGAVFDLDSFISSMAVLMLSGAFDQYTGWGPHNYYLYRSSATGRWFYLPWDLDVGFAQEAFGRIAVIDDWHAAWPVPAPPRPLLERIVADDELLALYRQRVDRLLETSFRPEALEKRLDTLFAQIAPHLAEDPFPHRRATVPGDTDYESIVQSMKAFMHRRYETARAQIDSPGPRPDFAARGKRGHGPGRRGDPREQPRPGSPSADAPSDLCVVERGARRIRLEWKDNATDEGAFIVQRCTGADCDGFRNAVGLPGPNQTAATDTNVEPAATYRYRVFALRPTPSGPRGTGVSNVVTVGPYHDASESAPEKE